MKPVLMYGCEVWGASIKEEKDFTNFGGEVWERFHLRVWKNNLGVHKSTSNLATISEIGRYPMKNDIHKQMVRYLLRFNDMDDNRLAKQCYFEQEVDSTGNHWVGKTKQVLNNLGLSYMHKIKPGEKKKPTEINRLSYVTRNRENEIFEQNLVHHRDVQMERKQGNLSFLHKLKENFGQEDYLQINNANYRQKIAQFCLSAHKLEIETGRHKDIEREHRICMYCRKRGLQGWLWS